MRVKAIVCLFVLALSVMTGAFSAESRGKPQNMGKEINSYEARLEYARLLRNLKRYDESLVQFRKLLESKPDSQEVMVEIAQVYYYEGEKKQALDILEKVPSDKLGDSTLLMMADIYVAEKDYPRAETIFRAQIKKEPHDTLATFKLAELLSWQKRYDESIAIYQQLLDGNPKDIQLRRKYAMVLMWMGKDKEAAEELEKTLE